jgi:hypothetical protein
MSKSRRTWAEFLEHNQQLLAAAKGAVERDIADNRATVYPARAEAIDQSYSKFKPCLWQRTTDLSKR